LVRCWRVMPSDGGEGKGVVTVRLLPSTEHWLTNNEIARVRVILVRARDRLTAKAKRNGHCPCRCGWPLEDDGSNRCGCCNQPGFEACVR
jgi:hypothetical protein